MASRLQSGMIPNVVVNGASSKPSTLMAGTKFETLWEKYSEDTFYTNGYYLSESSDFIPEVVKAALSMKVGEWVCVESEYGTHFLYRLENDAGAWKNEQNADFFEDYETTVKNADFMEYLDTLLPDVTVDDKVVDCIASMTDDYFVALFGHLFPNDPLNEQVVYHPYFE